VARVPWSDVHDLFSREHKQGQHVAIVGTNGSGKTTLGIELCKMVGARTATDGRPSRVVVLGYKPRDKTLRGLQSQGWKLIKRWPPSYGEEHVIVWPKYGDPETAPARQSRVFRALLKRIYSEGGQTVFIDEMAKFDRPPPEGFGLRALTSEYWTTARALDLTLIGATQRPREVSRGMWSEPSFVFAFRTEDTDDVKRVVEIAGRHKLAAIEAIDALGDHEFVMIVRRGHNRGIYVSQVDSS
jgi:energy-coupling factor transporter ATP-binding protein EcfA2